MRGSRETFAQRSGESVRGRMVIDALEEALSAVLQGTRLVTLAQNVPGPAAAARLQDFGASVVKVEPSGGEAHFWERLLRQLGLEDATRKDLKEVFVKNG